MKWRLIESGAGSPVWNMALDEALLDLAAEVPTLRLYRWRPAALSLGRFQKLEEIGQMLPDEIPRVRRITGGGTLHHREDEVTYSIVAPYSVFGGRGSPKIAYRAVHAAIEKGLATLGLEGAATADRPATTSALCYDRVTDYDLAIRERKLVGSAQRRSGKGFLQHGAIPLSPDPFSKGAISLSELLGRSVSPDEVERALVRGFRESLAVELVVATTTEDELSLARRLEEKYASVEWTRDAREPR